SRALSVRKPTNRECRRWSSGVHSVNCPTSTGFNQRQSFIFCESLTPSSAFRFRQIREGTRSGREDIRRSVVSINPFFVLKGDGCEFRHWLACNAEVTTHLEGW